MTSFDNRSTKTRLFRLCCLTSASYTKDKDKSTLTGWDLIKTHTNTAEHLDAERFSIFLPTKWVIYRHLLKERPHIDVVIQTYFMPNRVHAEALYVYTGEKDFTKKLDVTAQGLHENLSSWLVANGNHYWFSYSYCLKLHDFGSVYILQPKQIVKCIGGGLQVYHTMVT